MHMCNGISAPFIWAENLYIRKMTQGLSSQTTTESWLSFGTMFFTIVESWLGRPDFWSFWFPLIFGLTVTWGSHPEEENAQLS